MLSIAYRRYALALLTIIVMFNFVDRFALGVVLENIKRDLSLTDTQLGFLTGIAFAAFYSVMGIPIARWADRGNRVTIISVRIAERCGLDRLTIRNLIKGAFVHDVGKIAISESILLKPGRLTADSVLNVPLSGVLSGWMLCTP